jgi:hypothetical protein
MRLLLARCDLPQLIICCCVRCCNSLGTGVWPDRHAAARQSFQAAEVKLGSVQLLDTASLSTHVLPSMASSNSSTSAVTRSMIADVPGSVAAVAPHKWYSPSKKYIVTLQEDMHLFIYTAAPPNNVTWQTFIFNSDVTSEVKLLLMVSCFLKQILCALHYMRMQLCCVRIDMYYS